MVDRTPIEFAPGVFRKGTFAQMAGRWYDTQLMRWIEGVLRPVGGIERFTLTMESAPFTGFASRVRATHVWMTHDGIVRVGVLCEQHLYVVTMAGEVLDVSPTGEDAIQGPGSSVDGGYGDGIYYGAAGGLTDFTKLLPDEDPGPLPPVYEDPTGYNTARPGGGPTTEVVIGAMWTLDNFGDLLVAMASTDTRLLLWDPAAPSTPAAEVVPTPPDPEMDPPEPGGGLAPRGRFFVVTPERHVMVFNTLDGGNFPNRFEWCSQENIKDWLYSNVNNSAGFYDIEPASPFVTALPTRTGILAFTAARAYLISYAAAPYFYSYALLGYFAAPISGHAITRTAASVYWFSFNGFWTFDGINISQVPSTLLDYVQRRIDPVWCYRRTHAVYLGNQNEVWFFYPSRGSQENDSYVIYSFGDEPWWSMGRLSRTCGSPGSAMTFPIMSDGTTLFFHEKGDSFADAPELPYAQSGAISVLKGARQATVRQGIADTAAPANDVQFRIGARRDRILDGTGIEDVEMALAIRRDEGKVDFRVTGRDLYLRVEAVRNGVPPWTFGQMLVKVIPRGSR